MTFELNKSSILDISTKKFKDCRDDIAHLCCNYSDDQKRSILEILRDRSGGQRSVAYRAANKLLDYVEKVQFIKPNMDSYLCNNLVEFETGKYKEGEKVKCTRISIFRKELDILAKNPGLRYTDPELKYKRGFSSSFRIMDSISKVEYLNDKFDTIYVMVAYKGE